jgi:hypothetical protein
LERPKAEALGYLEATAKKQSNDNGRSNDNGKSNDSGKSNGNGNGNGNGDPPPFPLQRAKALAGDLGFGEG